MWQSGSAPESSTSSVWDTMRPVFKTEVDGSVKAHGDFATTFQDVYQLLEAEEPLITIMEQVDGFDMPFSSTDRQSPRERPAKGGCGITDYSCFYFDVSLDSSYFASHVTSH